MKGKMLFFVVAAALCSCSEVLSTDWDREFPGERIVFSDNVIRIESELKSGMVPVVSELPCFYVNCIVGTPGTAEKTVFNVLFSGKGKYSGGQYWPPFDSGYKFYASNVPVTPGSHGPVLSREVAVNSADVVVAVCLDAEYKAVNRLMFDHIFARTGKCRANAPQGYSVSDFSVSFNPGVAGDYNIYEGSGKNDGTGWSRAVEGNTVTFGEDIFLVPGNYDLTVSYTLSRGSYVENFSKTVTVLLVAGKVNNLVLNLPEGNDADVSVYVGLDAWTGSQNYFETI